jgi:thioredoxin-dependent peroxiredoxin
VVLEDYEMKMFRSPGLAVLTTTFLVGTAGSVLLGRDSIPAEGSKATDFTLQSQEGKPVNLHDFRGHWIVLYFYPKDMTKGCTIEAHNFQRDLAQYEAKKATVIGVSVDSVDSHQQFCTKESLSFRLLSDPTHRVVDEYGSVMHFGPNVVAARNTFIIDPNFTIRKVYTKVNPEPHSQEVLAELTELQKAGE